MRWSVDISKDSIASEAPGDGQPAFMPDRLRSCKTLHAAVSLSMGEARTA